MSGDTLWPAGHPSTLDPQSGWQCRSVRSNGRTMPHRQRLQLLDDGLIPLVEDVHVRLEHADVGAHLQENGAPPSAIINI